MLLGTYPKSKYTCIVVSLTKLSHLILKLVHACARAATRSGECTRDDAPPPPPPVAGVPVGH